MAVLECETDPEVPLERAAYGVAREGAKQLATRVLIRRWDLVVGELSPIHLELCHQRTDHLPCVGQGCPDAIDKFGFIDLASLGLFEEGR